MTDAKDGFTTISDRYDALNLIASHFDDAEVWLDGVQLTMVARCRTAFCCTHILLLLP
jgi:hypothetical protein